MIKEKEMGNHHKVLVYPEHWVWETPASAYSVKKVGKAQIKQVRMNKGTYPMYNVKGYEYFELASPIKITTLRIGKETVMVDDPLHWYGMEALARNCKGKVLIAGLGLGLILHALQENKEVTEIHVVEKEADVIELMKGNIPDEDDRIRIIHDDIEKILERIQFGSTDNLTKSQTNPEVITIIRKHRELAEKAIEKLKLPAEYDTVVLDIWRGHSDFEMARHMFVMRIKTSLALPKAKIMIWGKTDSELNPAVMA